MQPLDKTLRNKLECTVEKARETAEQAARSAIEQLGVGEAKPYEYLTETQRQLRVKLRAHGRHLGDYRDPQTKQGIENLVEETAYEHWHRMLFARFLAENNLLMYPDPDDPVAITLEECEDLAADEGASNGWELAARYATRMLPQIFRIDSPVFELSFPPEHQQKLENLLADLPQEVFTAADSLGWVYQFWQTRRKEAVNQSGVKIGAKELPAVTQIFTDPYMVSFLLDNSLGAWWAGKRLSEADLKNAETEQELRQKAALPGMPLEYLRFVKEDNEKWTPAAGTFDAWPDSLGEFKVMDPCCGSGHFLVAAFHMLVPIRMEMEGLSSKDAVDAVLRDNLHGLEIDKRCVELAAFALAFNAWMHSDALGYRPLPEVDLACCGLAINAEKEELHAFKDSDPNLRIALEEIYNQFSYAPQLGSLINPEVSIKENSFVSLSWDKVWPNLKKFFPDGKDEEMTEMGIKARGLAKAAKLLTQKYDWIITNVPYKTKGDLVPILQEFIERYHNDAKAALETSFLDRCLRFLSNHGVLNLVLPQNMLFLSSYKRLRKRLLENLRWNFVTWLGENAFSSPVDAAPILISLENTKCLNDIFSTVDVSSSPSVVQKSQELKQTTIKKLKKTYQLKNPDHRISYLEIDTSELLSTFAYVNQGIPTSDTPLFVQFFWEQSHRKNDWEFFQSTLSPTKFYGGRESVILYEFGQGKLRALSAAQTRDRGRDRQGKNAWDKKGVAINLMGVLSASIYSGDKFDINIGVIIPKNEKHFTPIWAFCSSSLFGTTIRVIDKKRNVTVSTLVKVPFNIENWSKIAEEKYPHGLPHPYSDDPTQWIFHGHPCGSVIWDEEKKWTEHGPLRNDDTVLQVAVARLLGYRWPAETDPEIELSDESRQWVKKCEALLPFADDDGLVCIPAVRGELNAEERLISLLAKAYGNEWSTSKLNELLAVADHAGKSLESWLRDKFFIQHCKLFHHRPFIWQIWDGLRDGFSVLVNYHKLDYKLLETLIYTYLGDWITRQKDNIAEGQDGAQERLAAAQALKKKLELILEGEEPCDIFVRWKPLEQQPIGWNPDLNDGVRLNIRPFMTVPAVRKKGAGVLRDKPNIKWTKDRGTDVPSAPWYHLGPEYGGNEGDRINEHHLSLAEKDAARKNAI